MPENDFRDWVQDDFTPHVISHCHEALEKFLKAILIKYQLEFKYVHELEYLINKVPLSEDDKTQLENTFIILDNLYHYARYPSKSERVSVDDAKKAYERSVESSKILKKYL